MNYEQDLSDILDDIRALRGTHVDCYACNPDLGYALVYHGLRGTEGSYLLKAINGLKRASGPMSPRKARRGFLARVKVLGGKR